MEGEIATNVRNRNVTLTTKGQKSRERIDPSLCSISLVLTLTAPGHVAIPSDRGHTSSETIRSLVRFEGVEERDEGPTWLGQVADVAKLN